MSDVLTGARVFVKLKIRKIRPYHHALTAKGLTAALQCLRVKIGGIKPKLRQTLPWTVIKCLPVIVVILDALHHKRQKPAQMRHMKLDVGKLLGDVRL